MATKVKKQGKKKWVSIMSSSEFRNTFMGESLVYDPKELIGRNVKLSLAILSRNPREQNFKVSFLIREIKDNNALTEMVGYEVVQSYLKRVVKKGRDKIDVTLKLKSKENIDMILKLIFVTKNKASSKILKDLREKCIKEVTGSFSKIEVKDIIGSLLKHVFQKELKQKLSKIYPLAVAEVIHFSLVRSKK